MTRTFAAIIAIGLAIGIIGLVLIWLVPTP